VLTIKRFIVGIPAYGNEVVAQHAGMWFSLGQARTDDPNTKCLGVITVDTNGVDRARNRLIGEAMVAGADWLLMVDADTWISGPNPGKSILSMMQQLRDSKTTIVGAPVMRRGAPGFSVYRRVDDLYASIQMDLLTDQQPRFMEVDAIGAAVMAIDLHKIGDTIFEFPPHRSEDLEFCRRIKALGMKIFVDRAVPTCHAGNPPTLEYRP